MAPRQRSGDRVGLTGGEAHCPTATMRDWQESRRLGPASRCRATDPNSGTRRSAVSNRHDWLFPPLSGVERSIVRGVLGQR